MIAARTIRRGIAPTRNWNSVASIHPNMTSIKIVQSIHAPPGLPQARAASSSNPWPYMSTVTRAAAKKLSLIAHKLSALKNALYTKSPIPSPQGFRTLGTGGVHCAKSAGLCLGRAHAVVHPVPRLLRRRCPPRQPPTLLSIT